MKKVLGLCGLVLLLVVGPISYAGAASLPTGGTWVGTAKRITEIGACANVPVTLTVTLQCSTLIRGTVKVGTDTVTVVGRIEADNTLYLNGYKHSTSEYLMVNLEGKYTTTPSPRIVVDGFMFYDIMDFQQPAFNIFTLIKQ